MTTTPGAGVTERQEDWTFESLLQDFAADKKLSRAKKAWLNQEYDRIDLSAQPNIAGQFWCDELDLPQAVYLVQLVAHLLDFLKPRKAGEVSRLLEISKELHALGYLSDEEFEALDR